MPFDKDYIDLNDKLIRTREMDHFRYNTFLNHIGRAYEMYNKIEDEEARLTLLGFTNELICRFIETYGPKGLPDDMRKSGQELIISKNWNFN